MKTLIKTFIEQLDMYANSNDFKNYGIVYSSFLELIAKIYSQKNESITINDRYNIDIYGIDTNISFSEIQKRIK